MGSLPSSQIDQLKVTIDITEQKNLNQTNVNQLVPDLQNCPPNFYKIKNQNGEFMYVDESSASVLFKKDNKFDKNNECFKFTSANDSNSKNVSVQTVNNKFIRHAGYKLWAHNSDGSDLFNKDSSFIKNNCTDPNNKNNNLFMLQSSNYPLLNIRNEGKDGVFIKPIFENNSNSNYNNVCFSTN